MDKHTIRNIVAAAVTFAAMACNSDINRSASPVELIATNTQKLSLIDLFNTTNCNQSIGTINMQAITKNPSNGSTNTTFNQVRVTRYQVSYVRTDGGKTVPAPFIRSIDTLVAPGGSADLTSFLVVAPDALTQSPFVALRPVNGGKDPDTGSKFVKMDVIVTLFGETLAGTSVSASTRFPLDFCFDCGGCS
jgi:hypothetical protein